ncbi:MAG: hypothetical protein P3X22_004730 [Thermoprotei archaeon]|nr:hypothetical protein [Thermoprotei archaeon]
MTLEDELKVKLENPLALILTVLTIIAYILLFAVYTFNRPDPTVLNMSMPLLYALLLWVAIAVIIVVAAYKLWR